MLNMHHRVDDLIKFYDLLERLERQIAGKHRLVNCNGKMSWPVRGIYFFMEDGEFRTETGSGFRIVRVGTHALKSMAKTSLWGRLQQHKGQEKSDGGNHRGSIFRSLVGNALMNKLGSSCPTWGQGNTAKGETRRNENPIEQNVSSHIRNMPFIWLAVDDAPGPESLRGYIEKNSISLLSNYKKRSVDTASRNWLGHNCDREKVRESGLWNQNHVDENYDPAFLDTLELILKTQDKSE